jgi:ABC-type Zn uptake system ZnuABC Zn-binding protein ZnuA
VRRTVALLAAATTVLAACSGDGSDDATTTPVVVVPNEILADLVERVSCVADVDTVMGVPPDGVEPVLVVTLDEEPPDADVLAVSVPAIATTIDRPGPDDAWVWLDPIRFGEIAQGVGGALTLTDAFDAELIDRCLARLDAEMAELDETLFAMTQAIADDRRVIDVSAPGVAYFATRYEFLVDESNTAIRAGGIISTDRLDGAASYDEMMLANVERVIELLGSG